MPSCAAAPRSREIGFAISGPKSVIAPTARNIMQGKKLDFTPMYMTPRMPDSYQCWTSLGS